MNKKIFIPLLLLIFILLIASLGYYLLTKTSHFYKIQSNKSEQNIDIKGDNDCKIKTKSALNLLQKKAKSYYDKVEKYVGVIECADRGSGMFAWESPPRFKAGKATYEAGTIWYAGAIVHDACHSQQYHDYLSNNNTSSVPNDIWSGKEAEKQCLDIQYNALTKIGADQNTLDYVKNSINSNYWEVDYNDRWW